MGRGPEWLRRSPAPRTLALPLLAVAAIAGCGNLEEPGERPDEPIVAAPQDGATGPDGPRPDSPPAEAPQADFKAEAAELCREVGSDLERELASLPAGESDLSAPFVEVLGPFSADLRALGPPPELLPALDRLDALVAEAERNPKRLFGSDVRALETMTDELAVVSRGFNRAGLQNCGA